MKNIKVLLSILLFFAVCSVGFSQSTSETKEIGYIIFAPDTAIFENEVEARILLDQYVKSINDISSNEKQIHINGWTAIFDNDVDPIKLSTDRANVILNELKLRGISEERLDIAKGNGGTSIFGNNNVPEERKLNRRVTISIDEVKIIPAKVEPARVDPPKVEQPKSNKPAFKINWKKVLIVAAIIVAVIALVLLVLYVIIPAIGGAATAGAGAGAGGVAKGAKSIFGKLKNVFKSKPSNLKPIKPVDGVGGKFVGRKWKIDMNNIPKRANDLNPMTQRELLKLNNNLINGPECKNLPKKVFDRINREYGNIVKTDNLEIPFKRNGEPDFSKIAFEKVKINYTNQRWTAGGVKGNFDKAHEICSEKWGWSLNEFKDWYNKLQMTWHETKDGLYLVPKNIHNNIVHEGLIGQINQGL